MAEPNTVFLRLEGPLQSWGDNSKFVIRRTMDAPTKSGVLGLICCAEGLTRQEAGPRLKELKKLRMGVRIDRPGTRWWDYHTVGAGYGILNAQGVIKRTGTTKEYETLISRREYLCDASFLVALQSDDPCRIKEIFDILSNPKRPVFLGRKSCPPCVPVLALPFDEEAWSNPDSFINLEAALAAVPWRPRLERVDDKPAEGEVETLVEWRQSSNEKIAPSDAEVWYDSPKYFDPPVHEPRLVIRGKWKISSGNPLWEKTTTPRQWRPSSLSDPRKEERRVIDKHICVFCKSKGVEHRKVDGHHLTYRRLPGDETMKDLRSLCRLCHDAVTMIEYGLGMGLDRINPEDPRWRDKIIAKREEIIKFRSLETRRRRLSPDEVE
jgi:CRISPR-associated protein Cas5/CasD subtype I-E